MRIKEFIVSMFSKEGEVSSKRVIGFLGFIVTFFIIVRSTLSTDDITNNELALLTTLSWIMGVLVGGGSIESIFKSSKK